MLTCMPLMDWTAVAHRQPPDRTAQSPRETSCRRTSKARRGRTARTGAGRQVRPRKLGDEAAASRHPIAVRMPEPGTGRPTPLPFLASRRRRGATELCRMAILGPPGSGLGEEKTQESTRRPHRSHASRQAFRHFGTRLILVHRSNGSGVRRPRCSYLGLTVRASGSQVLFRVPSSALLNFTHVVPPVVWIRSASATAARIASSRRGMAPSGSLLSGNFWLMVGHCFSWPCAS